MWGDRARVQQYRRLAGPKSFGRGASWPNQELAAAKLASTALLSTQASADRRVWSIPLNTVRAPFFTATNVQGATDYITKPFSPPELPARIEVALGCGRQA